MIYQKFAKVVWAEEEVAAAELAIIAQKHLGNDYEYKSFLDIILLYGNEGKDVKEIYNEKYFQNDDHLFKSFFDNLKMYMEVHKSIYEVYHKVAKLLNGHPDLLEEFTKLFADSSAIGILKQYLY
ncbi:hypothetical protein FXO37_03305 [Capsicum annuum]|nr:hypothetical protein FXO37_03305 [Capsicum annuum]